MFASVFQNSAQRGSFDLHLRRRGRSESDVVATKAQTSPRLRLLSAAFDLSLLPVLQLLLRQVGRHLRIRLNLRLYLHRSLHRPNLFQRRQGARGQRPHRRQAAVARRPRRGARGHRGVDLGRVGQRPVPQPPPALRLEARHAGRRLLRRGAAVRAAAGARPRSEIGRVE